MQSSSTGLNLVLTLSSTVILSKVPILSGSLKIPSLTVFYEFTNMT